MLKKIGEFLNRPLTESGRRVQDAAKKSRTTAEKQSTAAGAGPTQDGDALTKDLLKAAGKVGAAAIAAIGGFVGVVALVGTALLWERFDQAGIPAEQAMAKVDQAQKLTYGGEAIIIAVLIAIGVLALVWAFDSNATVTPLSVILIGLLVAGGATFAALQHITALSVIGTAGFAIILGIGALVVANKTAGQFVPFVGAVVLATALFNLLVFFLVTEQHVPVTPAAVVQPDGTPFAGYYVSDGTENIYLAIPAKNGGAPILRTIPRTDDTELAIGHAVDRSVAGPKLKEVLARLQAQPAKKPTAQPTP